MLTRLVSRLRQLVDSSEVPRRSQLAFYFAAGGLFVIATIGAYLEADGLRHGPVTHGIIVERDHGGKVATVTLRFPVPGRGEVECSTDTFRNDAQPGQSTRVRYDPEDPTGTCSTGERGSYVGFVLTAILATALLATGERLRRRRARMQPADAE